MSEKGFFLVEILEIDEGKVEDENEYGNNGSDDS